jgi:putative transposase
MTTIFLLPLSLGWLSFNIHNIDWEFPLPETLTAIKSVKQPLQLTPELLQLMETFRRMVNDCIRIGLQNKVSSMKRLSKLSYKQTGQYNIVNYYRLCAISHTAGILTNRKKSIKRGLQPKQPYAIRPMLTSCYGFKIIGSVLRIPLGNKQYFDIPLTVTSEMCWLILWPKFIPSRWLLIQ